jgi:hypothetical protein
MKRLLALAVRLPPLPLELHDRLFREAASTSSYVTLAKLRRVSWRARTLLDEAVWALIETYIRETKGGMASVMEAFRPVPLRYESERLWLGLSFLSLYQANFACAGARLYQDRERSWWYERDAHGIFYYDEKERRARTLTTLENMWHVEELGTTQRAQFLKSFSDPARAELVRQRLCCVVSEEARMTRYFEEIRSLKDVGDGEERERFQRFHPRLKKGFQTERLSRAVVRLGEEYHHFFSEGPEMCAFRERIFFYLNYDEGAVSPVRAYHIKRRGLTMPPLDTILTPLKR